MLKTVKYIENYFSSVASIDNLNLPNKTLDTKQLTRITLKIKQ